MGLQCRLQSPAHGLVLQRVVLGCAPVGRAHRESWAVEKRAPSRADWEREQSAQAASSPNASTVAASPTERSPRRIMPPATPRAPDPLEADALIVMSKLKNYVRGRSGFNTSDRVVTRA
jgi:hypothetical protein